MGLSWPCGVWGRERGIGGIHSGSLALAWGEGGTKKPPQAALSCQLCIFWGNSLFLGGCICSVSRLQSLDIHRGDSRQGGWSVTGPWDRDSACCFQRPPSSPSGTSVPSSPGETQILRRTNSRKRHEGKGERRYKKTQYGLFPVLPLISSPQ